MRLDPTLPAENLATIASGFEITPMLLDELAAHPAAWQGLKDWVAYVKTTGVQVPPPAVGEPSPVVLVPVEPTRPQRSALWGKRVLAAVAGMAVVAGIGVGGWWWASSTRTPDVAPSPARSISAPPPSPSMPAPEPVLFGGLSSAGDGFACGVRANRVTCVGVNDHGELGTGTPTPTHSNTITLTGKVTALTSGAGFTCAATKDAVTCWGDNRWNQAGMIDKDILPPTKVQALKGQVVSLSAGEIHTCAALADKSVWCWGSDYSGQLGHGKQGKIAGEATKISVPPTDAVISSRFGACAYTTGKKTVCWGANDRRRIANTHKLILPPTEVAHE